MTPQEFALAAMLNFFPTTTHERRPWGDEEREATVARYTAISAAIGEACETSKTPRRCAALLVAIGGGESGFARDADDGPCYREGGYKSRCDGGRAASVWQVHAHCAAWAEGKCAEWVTVDELFADRTLAAKAVLRQASWSIKHCKNLSGLTGACVDAGAGHRSAAAREALWRKIERWQPATKK